MREGSDSALDLAGITHVDRAHLHPERRRDGLDRSELARPRGKGGIPNDRRSRYAGRDLFEHLQPFPAQTVFVRDEPSGIAARSRETVDEAGADWIRHDHEHDWHGAGRL